MNLINFYKKILRYLNHNSSTVLTGISVAGFISTVVMAIHATPKALYIIEDMKISDDGESDIKRTYLDIIKAVYPIYIPTVIMGAGTILCMVYSNKISIRRNAALLSLYTISEKALAEYQNKIMEKIGSTKKDKIETEIIETKLNNNPPVSSNIILTGGNMLCFDSFSGRYFYSDVERLKQTENEFNRRLLTEMELTLNELYYEIGLDPIELGNHVGWQIEKGLIKLSFDAKLVKGNTPCIVVNYNTIPRYS